MAHPPKMSVEDARAQIVAPLVARKLSSKQQEIVSSYVATGNPVGLPKRYRELHLAKFGTPLQRMIRGS